MRGQLHIRPWATNSGTYGTDIIVGIADERETPPGLVTTLQVGSSAQGLDRRGTQDLVDVLTLALSLTRTDEQDKRSRS